jgi:hypothetical protein
MVLSRWQHYVFHSSPDGDGGEEDTNVTHPTPLQAVAICRRKFWRFIVVGAAAEKNAEEKFVCGNSASKQTIQVKSLSIKFHYHTFIIQRIAWQKHGFCVL